MAGWIDLFVHSHQNICVVYSILPLPNYMTGVLLLAVCENTALDQLNIGLLRDGRADPPSLLAPILKACDKQELALRVSAVLGSGTFMDDLLRELDPDAPVNQSRSILEPIRVSGITT